MLEEATDGPGFAKIGFLGFHGGGKTFTAGELAIYIREFFKLDGPIGMFCTEHGSDFLAPKVLAKTGKRLVRAKSRSLDDLLTAAREAESTGVSVFITDSLTHVWKELLESYLAQRAEKHREQRRAVISDSIDPDDWARIKAVWQRWVDWFVSSPMHVIVCGRAGWDYDRAEDADGKRELVKIGVKLKADTEFGYEPNLLVEMQQSFARDERGELSADRRIVHRAVVIKDRNDVLDGRVQDNPTPEFFRPHLESLSADNHRPIHTVHRTRFCLDGENRDEWEREREARTIAWEKIRAAFARAGIDGQSADDKARRAEVMEKYWGTTSATELSQRTPSNKMLVGLTGFELEAVLVKPDDEIQWAPEAPRREADQDAGESAPEEKPARKRGGRKSAPVV